MIYVFTVYFTFQMNFVKLDIITPHLVIHNRDIVRIASWHVFKTLVVITQAQIDCLPITFQVYYKYQYVQLLTWIWASAPCASFCSQVPRLTLNLSPLRASDQSVGCYQARVFKTLINQQHYSHNTSFYKPIMMEHIHRYSSHLRINKQPV